MPGSVSGAFYAPWHSGCLSVSADFVFCDGSPLRLFSVSIRRFLASRERGHAVGPTPASPSWLLLQAGARKRLLASGP